MQTNSRAEKLTAGWACFTSHGILDMPTWQPCVPHPIPLDDDEDQSGAAEEGTIYNEVFLTQTHGMFTVKFHANQTNHLNSSSKLST